jgi:hypothetical protein
MMVRWSERGDDFQKITELILLPSKQIPSPLELPLPTPVIHPPYILDHLISLQRNTKQPRETLPQRLITNPMFIPKGCKVSIPHFLPNSTIKPI